MSDPYLDAHRYLPKLNLFALSGERLSPVGIRDQLLRGKFIVNALLKDHVVGLKKPLLIVGAGAAGVSAALWAVENGALVTLVDRESFPFSRQRHCTTKSINLVQYDWPIDHWQEKSFPWGGGQRCPSHVCRIAGQYDCHELGRPIQ